MDRPQLPHFVVIGAMKAGTTALFHYLRQHPKIFMPVKETDFFSYHWDRGIDWYASLYANAGENALVGDASPSYTSAPRDSAARMAGVLPDTRLIYCVRDPVERIRAHYLHAVAEGKERRPIERALRETPWYVACSRYASWAELYLQFYQREQLLLLTAEDLRDHRHETLARVLDFLGLPTDWAPPRLDEMIHRTEDKRRPRVLARVVSRVTGRSPSEIPAGRAGALYRRVATTPLDLSTGALSERTRLELENDLREEVRRLRELMGPSFGGWGMLDGR